jgi:hypothetical protein
MAINLKFNVYYSTNKEGPWVLANPIPIDYDPSGYHTFAITGLLQDTLYYVTVVGGQVHNGTFYPLLTQHIGPVAQGAGSIGGVKILDLKSARTFSPHINTSDALGHQFAVV